MGLLFVLTGSLFFLWVIRDILFWIWLWQHNEYRADRFFADLKKKGPRITGLIPLLFFFKLLLLFVYGGIIFYDYLLPYYQGVIAVLFLFQAILIGKEIYRNRLKKPRLNLHAVLLLIFSLLTIVGIFIIRLMDSFFWLVLIDVSIPFIVAMYVVILSFPTEVFGDWQTDQALKKLRNSPNLIIIGVTGSYGKSLVKDYIAAVLSLKYKVIKTHGADNTLVGISSTILKHLESDTDVFVAEMSAYKRGEIRSLCQYIKPKIGVLTGINNQYKTLFKNQETINKTNYELVESLPKKGLCIFNGTNKHTAQLYKKSTKQKAIYTIEQARYYVPQTDIKAFHIIHKAKKTIFNVQFQDTTFLHVSIHSAINIEYVMPAIYVAYYLGMSESEIKKAVAQLK